MNRKNFEITDKEFLEFQDSVLDIFNKGDRNVQFKSYLDRKNAYMLIDNSGNAWIPSSELMSLSKFSYSLDGKKFTKIGKTFKAREGKWIGAKVGVFCSRPISNNDGGRMEIDWFRVSP